ncbi:MAG: hypothetical protein GEU95_02135 [Rhizobiales bacterium]|nr:hypothetical protein [Hyphomicrobiales bacterium]
MKHMALIVLSGLLLAGCGQSAGPLLPELKGRWVSDDSATLRFAQTTTGSGAPIAPSNPEEPCRSGYITFDKLPMDPEFAGSVTLHRQDGSVVVFLVGSASREGDRITMTGRPPNTPPVRRMQIELALRNGKVVFDDVLDRLGRSVRNDLFPADDSPHAKRVSFSTIGDHFRATLDLKPCGT